MTYVELQVTSHYSFLRGAAGPEELFSAAALLGYPALGITDCNTVGGLVRGLRGSRATGARLVAGCRLDLMDETSLLVWPEDRTGWSRLTRLLTLGKARADPRKGEKGQCFLHWEDVAAHAKTEKVWTSLRNRWEYSHVARAVFAGIALLALIVATAL